MSETTLMIPAPRVKHVNLTVKGLSPLICHNWDEKAKRQMRDKQMGKATTRKEAKSAEDDFRASLYIVPGREDDPDGTPGKYYFPASAFKAATVGAARFLGKDVTLVVTKGAIFIESNPVLVFDELVMREDLVRLNGMTADLRYRGEFRGWSAVLDVTFREDVLSLEQVVNLVNHGGYSQGIGEWRPSSPKALNGNFGRYEIVAVEEI